MEDKLSRLSKTTVRRVDQSGFLTRRASLGLGAVVGIATLFGRSSPAAAATGWTDPVAADFSSLKAVRVFTGEDGHSHFEDIQLKAETLPFHLSGESKVTPGFLKFFESNAAKLTILHGPPNLHLPWHNAPTSAHEFFLMLQGSNTLITRAASRVIVPGTLTFFEDATGTGHAGQVGPEGYTVLNVQLA